MSVTSRKDWPLVQVEELAANRQHALTIGPFGSDLKTSDYRASGVPVVFVRNVQPGRFVDATPRYVSDRKAKELAAHRVVPGDLVVTKMGLPPCVTAVYPDSHPEGIVTADIIKLSLDKRIADPTYVTLFLNSPFAQQQVGLITNGVTRPKVTLRDFKQLRIPLPPLPEQRRIAEVLDRAEALRAKRREALARSDTLSEALFLWMFGRQESASWPVQPVAEIAAPGKDSVRTGPFGSQLLHGEFLESGEVAVLGIDNVVANEFRSGESRYISESKYQELKRYTVRPGDVLITIMGTCGRCAVVPDDIPLAINTKHLCCVSLDRGQCLPLYLQHYFLQHPVARQYLEQRAKGAIMAGLNMGIIKEMPVLLPPLHLQRDFAERMAAIDRLKASQRASLAEMEALFASLQHRAFRGEL